MYNANDSDRDGEYDERACPFCGNSKGCCHLLLVVDRTFRVAEGGTLMDAFNARWAAGREAAGESLDEGEAFETLLFEVEALSDAMIDYDHEGGPGMSSSYERYFLQSPEGMARALAFFTAQRT